MEELTLRDLEQMYTESDGDGDDCGWQYTLEELIEMYKANRLEWNPDLTDDDLERLAEDVRECLLGRWDEAEAEDIAAELYDGGWRSSDRELLMTELRMSEEQADQICKLFDTYEEDEKND